MTAYLTRLLQSIKVMANEGRLKMGLQLEEVEEIQDKAMWVLSGILEQNKDFGGRNHDIQTKPHLFISSVY